MTTRIDVAETVEGQKLSRDQFWTFGCALPFRSLADVSR
jgi:hypothetical protein